MPTKKYYAQFLGVATRIQRVEIDRETESSVWIKKSEKSDARREAKLTDWFGYFDTFNDAQKWMYDKARIKVAAAHEKHQNEINLMNAILEMVEPT